tara:strand:- start:450 stop:578 length:129 start_codon:yes stop_codon:yes gene_type:complete
MNPSGFVNLLLPDRPPAVLVRQCTSAAAASLTDKLCQGIGTT